jgi:hypothetical protein
VADQVISAVLVREEEEVQCQVYYAGKTLLDAETCYLRVEKMALVLMIASWKLRAYF